MSPPLVANMILFVNTSNFFSCLWLSTYLHSELKGYTLEVIGITIPPHPYYKRFQDHTPQ
jgi:hypothetical protein